ncbi:phage tail family protein [Microbacterium schleiferi]|uniref:Phage tail family protein n=1 Tax=Microbacterium schleiferi TaxID=69362 RepID=A0A7S8RGB4_9MICO|nr:phage tail domain-containing protein [Microbacterium schleiferi]QPE04136.1 phage tail family protein [Microbacterium schleiferi]
MSFVFGSFDTDSLGLIATLVSLPSVDGLSLETLEAVGTDGRILGGTTRSGATFDFDVVLEGSSPDDAAGKRDAFAAAVDPAKGEQWLTFDAAPDWRWKAILAARIPWARVTWDAAAGFKFRATVRFSALEAYGRLAVDESWEYTSPGSRVISRTKGNARSYPTVEIEGVLAEGDDVTVTLGDVECVVAGPLASGQVLRLDWDLFDFGLWTGGAKDASVVRGMSTLDRPELWPSVATPFNVATTGTVSRCALFANSRRQ